jgi:hypothetical protein
MEFAGDLTLAFSVYAPNVEDDLLKSALSEITTGSLCSVGVRLVSSKSLKNECPSPQRRHLILSVPSIARQMMTEATLDHTMDDETIVWNTPTIVSYPRELDENTYYSVWNFTYPVWDWGVDQDETALQKSLDAYLQSQVLPFENAKASVFGLEQGTFVSGNTLVETNIPQRTANVLQGVGAFMLVLNTIGVVLLTIAARRHREEKEDILHNPGNLESHQGVDEMLWQTRQMGVPQSPDSNPKEGKLVQQARVHRLAYAGNKSAPWQLTGTMLGNDEDIDDSQSGTEVSLVDHITRTESGEKKLLGESS